MRALVLTLLFACGPKKAPEPAAAAPVEAPAAPEPAAEPTPEPEPEVKVEVTNADFNASVITANGSQKSGHVKRVERSDDWFGEGTWLTDAKDIRILAETDTANKEYTWKDIKTITIQPGKVPADVDCVYDSNWSPWMYDCTLKTMGTATVADGSKWRVTSRQKWRFTFDDGSQVEFWLYKHPAREQDSQVVGLDTTNPENYDLYTRLQNRLREEVKTTMVTKIVIQ
jgi:hypothetical protein